MKRLLLLLEYSPPFPLLLLVSINGLGRWLDFLEDFFPLPKDNTKAHVCFITCKELINCYKCLHLPLLARMEGKKVKLWDGIWVRAGINRELTRSSGGNVPYMHAYDMTIIKLYNRNYVVLRETEHIF